jgi:hypothetical protein
VKVDDSKVRMQIALVRFLILTLLLAASVSLLVESELGPGTYTPDRRTAVAVQVADGNPDSPPT